MFSIADESADLMMANCPRVQQTSAVIRLGGRGRGVPKDVRFRKFSPRIALDQMPRQPMQRVSGPGIVLADAGYACRR